MRNRIITAITTSLLLLGMAFAAPQAQAQVAGDLNFQARLTDAQSNPITANTTVVFRLYTASTGGTAIWSETQNVTPNGNGVFSVRLGAVTAFSPNGGSPVTFNQTLFLGLTVGADAEMTPRFRLNSSPSAVRAEWVGGVDATSLNATVTSSNLNTLTAGSSSNADTLHTHSLPSLTGNLANSQMAADAASRSLTNSFSGSNTFSAGVSFTNAGAPFTVTSAGLVGNLNADFLDGVSEAAFGQLGQSEAVTGTWTFSSLATFSAAPTFTNTAATGPFTVPSNSQKVVNLNADQLDGVDSTGFAQLGSNQTVSGSWTFNGANTYTGVNTFAIGSTVNLVGTWQISSQTVGATAQNLNDLVSTNPTNLHTHFGFAWSGNDSTNEGLEVVNAGSTSSLFGDNSSTTIATTAHGIRGRTANQGAFGVLGENTDTTATAGNPAGVRGTSAHTTLGIGVHGLSASAFGVRGEATATNGVGIDAIGTGGALALETTGPSLFGGNLDITGANVLRIGGTATANQLGFSGGALNSGGNFTVGGNLAVVGTSSFTGGSTFSGAVTADTVSTTNATGTSALGGNLTVAGTSGFTGTVTANAINAGAISGTTGTFSAAVSGTTGTFSGAVSGTTGTFSSNVSGVNGTFTGTLSSGGITAFGGPTSVSGSNSFSVGTGPTSLGGTLGVTGNSIFTGTATHNNNVSVTGSNSLTVGTGTTTLGGPLGVSGASTLGGAATFNNTATFNGTTAVGGSNTFTVGTGLTTLNGGLNVNGASNLTGAVSVTGANSFAVGTGGSTLGGALTVAGLSTFNNNVDISGTNGLRLGGAAASNTFSYDGTNTRLQSGADFHVGNNLTVAGTSTFTGTATYGGTLGFQNGTGFTMSLSGTPTANRTITLPNTSDTAVLESFAQTLTNKSIALGTNNISGSLVEFNAALTGASFASLTGTEALTNKTIALGNNTLSGSLADFNAALSGGSSFASLAGTEVLTNKTINGNNNSLTVLASQINGTIGVATGGTGVNAIAQDNLLYSSSANTLSATTLSPFARTVIDDADAATARGTLGAQQQGNVLDDLNIVGAPTAANTFLISSGAGTFGYQDVASTRNTLGLGTADSPTFGGLTVTGTSTFTGAATYAGTIGFQNGTGNTMTLTGTPSAGRTITFPDASGTAVFESFTQTLSAKTIALGSNTVSGTFAQFNTAVTDATLASVAGTETFTNKTISLAGNTVSGTFAQFNAAVSDATLASVAGAETLTNKIINGNNNTLTVLSTQLTGAIAPANGGTGLSAAPTTTQILLGSGAGTYSLVTALPDTLVAQTNVTQHQAALSVATSQLTGNIGIANGGTGTATAPTSGQVLIGNSSGGYTVAGVAGTTNQVSVTSGSGSITLSTPQDIHSGASPTFVGATLTGGATVGGTLAVTGLTSLNGGATLPTATTLTLSNASLALPTGLSSISGGGAGSGLNADVIDGLDSTAFLQDSGTEVITGAWSFNTTTGTVPFAVDATDNSTVTNLNADMVDGIHAGSFLRGDANTNLLSTFTLNAQAGSTLDVDGALVAVNATSVSLPGTGITGAGTGSGLDADDLDGIDSASFLRSDADDTWSNGGTGTLTLGVAGDALSVVANSTFGGTAGFNGVATFNSTANIATATDWQLGGVGYLGTMGNINELRGGTTTNLHTHAEQAWSGSTAATSTLALTSTGTGDALTGSNSQVLVTATAGGSHGVHGVSTAPAGYALYAENTNTGALAGTNPTAIFGVASHATRGIGVHGATTTGAGTGVRGEATATGGVGVHARGTGGGAALNIDGPWQISGVPVNAVVTASALNTLTGTGNADTLHTHSGGSHSHAIYLEKGLTAQVWGTSGTGLMTIGDSTGGGDDLVIAGGAGSSVTVNSLTNDFSTGTTTTFLSGSTLNVASGATFSMGGTTTFTSSPTFQAGAVFNTGGTVDVGVPWTFNTSSTLTLAGVAGQEDAVLDETGLAANGVNATFAFTNAGAGTFSVSADGDLTINDDTTLGNDATPSTGDVVTVNASTTFTGSVTVGNSGATDTLKIDAGGTTPYELDSDGVFRNDTTLIPFVFRNLNSAGGGRLPVTVEGLFTLDNDTVGDTTVFSETGVDRNSTTAQTFLFENTDATTGLTMDLRTDGNLELMNGTNFVTTLTSAATADRTITFPDLSGTVALSSTAHTVSGVWTFNTASGSVPFVVDASDNSTVTNLNADLLDGVSEAAFAQRAQNEAITGTFAFNTSSGTVPFTVAATDNSIVTNLNADRLDSLHQSDFLRSNVADSWGVATVSGILDLGDAAGGGADTVRINGGNTLLIQGGGTDAVLLMNGDFDARLATIVRLPTGNGTISGGGNGTGLDADLLDGVNGADYLRSGANESWSVSGAGLFTMGDNNDTFTIAAGTLNLPTTGIAGAGSGSGLNADRVDGVELTGLMQNNGNVSWGDAGGIGTLTLGNNTLGLDITNIVGTFQRDGAAVTASAAEMNKLTGTNAAVSSTNLNTLTGGGSSDAQSLHTHNNLQPLDSDLTAVAGLSTTGVLVRTATGVAATRTLTAGTGIIVTNGDGVSANPTIAIDTATTADTSSAQTFTNKTFSDSTTFWEDNLDTTKKLQLQLSGLTTGTTRTLTAPNASGTLVLAGFAQTLTNKTLTSPVISTITNTGTLTLPTSTDTLVGRATTDTLTNKTLTSPVIASIVNTGTLTLPTSTDTLVGRDTADTLTNKTINLSVAANNSLIGTLAQFNAAVSDATLASLTGTETLTNKTLTSPVIGTILNTGTLTLPTSTDTLVGQATTDTLTNKTINLSVAANNSLIGTLAQFNAAVSDATLASLTGTETLTNKTLSSVASITVPSGVSTFNGNSVMGDAASDTLTVNASSTFVNPAIFSALATFNNNVTINGSAILLGDNASDALTVAAASGFNATASFNGDVNLGNGTDVIKVNGAAQGLGFGAYTAAGAAADRALSITAGNATYSQAEMTEVIRVLDTLVADLKAMGIIG